MLAINQHLALSAADPLSYTNSGRHWEANPVASRDA